MKLVENVKWLCALSIINFVCSVNAVNINIIVRNTDGTEETVACDNLDCVASLKTRVNPPKNCTVLYICDEKELSPYLSFAHHGISNGSVIDIIFLRNMTRSSKKIDNLWKKDNDCLQLIEDKILDFRLDCLDFCMKPRMQFFPWITYSRQSEEEQLSSDTTLVDAAKLSDAPLPNIFGLNVERIAEAVERYRIRGLEIEASLLHMPSYVPLDCLRPKLSEFRYENWNDINIIFGNLFNKWWYSTVLSKNMEDSLDWHYLEALEIDKQLRKVLKTYKHLYPYQYDWDPQNSFVFGDNIFESYRNIIKFLNNVIKFDSKGYWAAAFTCGVSYDEVCDFYGKGETVRDTEADYTVLFSNMFEKFGEGPEVMYIFKE